MSYLHRLQADTVKVDRSFVSRIGVEGNGSELVCAIVALAQNLGMDVVAEGVETAEQLSQLEALGCEYVQGFYFSKPVDVAAADRLIAVAALVRIPSPRRVIPIAPPQRALIDPPCLTASPPEDRTHRHKNARPRLT